MPRGGHARSGPARQPDALRRDRKDDHTEWIRLPESRAGKPPAWPLPTPVTAGGRKLWNALWRRGEATQWEAAGQEIQVALYVLAVLAAEGPKATAADRNAALRFMDDLGLSNAGRARNRWLIDDPGAHTEQPTDDGPKPRQARKDRLLELVVNQ